MNVSVPEEEIRGVVELLTFVADLCTDQPEMLNVALCRFTATYYPAGWFRADLIEAAERLEVLFQSSERSGTMTGPSNSIPTRPRPPKALNASTMTTTDQRRR